MITSKFFIPEFETDDDSSVEVFRYTLLKTEKDSVKYPIYLVFKNNSIEFQFQGKIQTNSNCEFDYLFVNAPIFVLPLGEKKYEETNEVIKRLFDKKISIKPYAVWENGVLISEYSLNNHDSDYSFSNLNVWGLENANWENINWIEKNKNGKETKCELKQKFLRRLLLDFLDDFFNANVFRQSPLYESIKAAILDSYILKGIYLKADFYSKKAFYKNDDNDELHKARYFETLDKWISFITTDEHKKLFATERTKSEPEAWFDFSDNEVTNSLLRCNFIFNNSSKENQKNEIVKRSANFLIQNYEIAKATLTLLTSYFTIPFWILAFLISCIIYYFQNLNFGNHSTIFLVLIILGTTIIYLIPGLFKKKLLNHDSHFRFNLFVYNDSYQNIKLYHFILTSKNIFNTLFLLSIFIFYGYTFLINKFDTILLYNNWQFLIIYCSFALCTGLLFIFYSIFNSSAINLILPRLLMALLTAWIAILVSLDSWKSFFDISVLSSIKYGSILILFTGFFLIFEIRRNTQITDFPKMIWKSLNVLIPAYLLSLTIGLLGISVLAEKSLKESDFFETKSVRKKIFQLKNFDYKKDKWENGFKILEKTKITKKNKQVIENHKSISNENLVDLLKQKDAFENPDTLFKSRNMLSLIYDDDSSSPQKFVYTHRINIPFLGVCEINIIPGFLILMAAFALFSGIFLTLLFDDKPVTDPL